MSNNEVFSFIKEHYIFLSFLLVVILIIVCETVDSIVGSIADAFSNKSKSNQNAGSEDKEDKKGN